MVTADEIRAVAQTLPRSYEVLVRGRIKFRVGQIVWLALSKDGERVATEISSVPLVHGDHVVGVFGQVSKLVEEPHAHPELHLTPRQSEVLELLERGRSTKQIADELHLSTETVRNHIRHLMRAIGAHSRLEAVAIANQAH